MRCKRGNILGSNLTFFMLNHAHKRKHCRHSDGKFRILDGMGDSGVGSFESLSNGNQA